jgi:S1-C subfamily serine protease
MVLGTRLFGRWPATLAAAAILLAACSGSTAPAPAASSGAAVSSAPASAGASAGAFDLSQIEASVAYIQTQGTFVTAEGAAEQTYSGSGFVIDPSGLIVTNNHVVTGGAFWKVSIGADKTLLDAQLIGVSECSDLALLKVSGTYPALSFSKTDPTVGEQIYVAGHPNGDPYTLTNGIVAKPPAPDDTSWASVKSEIQITAQTYPGNSGSPVIDAAGEVVGVQYSGGAPGSDIAGESFAISSSEAKDIVDQIKAANGNLDYIGLNGEVNADNTGIAVISVAPGSPADKAGIEAGDLLTNLNGTAVGTDGTKATYCSVLRSHQSDATLSVTVSRNGQTLSGEINGRPLASAGGSSTDSSPAPSSAASSSAPSDNSSALAKLQPFIPTAYWDSCAPYDTSYSSTIVLGARCSADGVDAVWYDLYANKADLHAAYAADVKSYKAKPSTDTVTCAKGNGDVDSTWSWNDQTGNYPDQGLLCYKATAGGTDTTVYAWIEQADPAINVMFTAALKSGNQVALDKWWLNNSTLIEP